MNALKAEADQDMLPEAPTDAAAERAEKLAGLSQRELDVLQHLVAGKQNREIAEALCISVKTVEFHRANIREKLGVANLPGLFRLVFGK